MIQSNTILFVPSCRRSNGLGHLKRSIYWGEQLDHFHIYLNPKDRFERKVLLPLFSKLSNTSIYWDNPPMEKEWDFIILDNRETGLDDFPDLLKKGRTICIDEGGPWRYKGDYLIDILPNLEQIKPNENSLKFLDLPYASCFATPQNKKVLVSFGGEDKKNLSKTLYLQILQNRKLQTYDWTFVKGPLYSQELLAIESFEQPMKGSIQVKEDQSSLQSLIEEHDFIISSFGLTAFESLSLGKPFYCINPSLYHDQLCEVSRFLYAEYQSFQPSSNRSLGNQVLSFLEKENLEDIFTERRLAFLGEHPRSQKNSFKAWLQDLNPSTFNCPNCLNHSNHIVFRTFERTYYFCDSCQLTYLSHLRVKDNLYKEDYFFSDYKKQYGKSYLDDFKFIESLGYKRLKRIQAQKKASEKEQTLLDVGCAFGPFLEAAKQKGLRAYGIDVSKEGVDYINWVLKGLKAAHSSFLEFKEAKGFPKSFDIITMWYVIEHFQDLNTLLNKVDSLLNQGGQFCFATPYAKGLSGRFLRNRFFKNSPEDHFTIWDKKTVKRILGKRGYHSIKIYNTGHHPERLPINLPFRSFLNKTILLGLSKLLSWGDTFEVYGIKGEICD